MDERIVRAIRAVATLEALAQLEKNVALKSALTSEVASAINARKVELRGALNPAKKAEGRGNPRSSAEGARVRRTRNPDWTRDELILALDLYLRFREAPFAKDDAPVIELSEALSEMARTTGFGDPGTYRNANGVYMKMMNFRRFDPVYTSEGKVGLTRGNQEEEHVWAEFANDREKLDGAVRAIRSSAKP